MDHIHQQPLQLQGVAAGFSPRSTLKRTSLTARPCCRLPKVAISVYASQVGIHYQTISNRPNLPTLLCDKLLWELPALTQLGRPEAIVHRLPWTTWHRNRVQAQRLSLKIPKTFKGVRADSVSPPQRASPVHLSTSSKSLRQVSGLTCCRTLPGSVFSSVLKRGR